MAEESRSTADPIPLDIQFQVKVIRLQCTYLRTLLGRLESELITIEQGLTTAQLVAPYRDEVTKQSELIAVETERLQGYLYAVFPPSFDAEYAL